MSGRIRNEADPPELRSQQPPATPEPPGREQPPAPAPRQPPPPPEEPLPAAADGGTPPEPPSPEQLAQETQSRIDRLTREKYEARRRAEEAERQLAQERQRQQQPRQPTQAHPYGPPGEQDAEQRGYQRAQLEQRAKTFNESCDALYFKGADAFGSEVMDDAVRRMNAVGWGNNPEALEALTSLPDAHKVYHALAQDMDRAHTILTMPPMRMAMELAKLASSQNGAPSAPPLPLERISRAPAPLRTISANSQTPEKPLDKLSIKEFIQRRDRDAPGPSARIRR